MPTGSLIQNMIGFLARTFKQIPFTSAESSVHIQEECFKASSRTETFSHRAGRLCFWRSLLMGADGWVCSLLLAVHQMLPFLPCTVQSTELPATTEEESSKGGSPARTQGSTVDPTF